MKLLITGAAGFLGGRLARHFGSRKKYSVRLASSQPAGESVQIDWNSQAQLEKVCTGIDAILHTSGMNAIDSGADPAAAFEINAVRTGRLLASAVATGNPVFLYFSTAHVYASPLAGTIDENTPVANSHPYAASHKAGEDLVSHYAAKYKLKGISLRISNSFGPPVTTTANCWMLLANDLCRQAVTTRKMVLQSTGLQRRDFIPIYDVCEAIEHLLHIDERLQNGAVYNIGGGWSPTIWEMALLIQERCRHVLGFSPELFRAEPEGGTSDLTLNYSVKKLLATGFHPRQNRETEIDEILHFCREHFRS